MNNFLKILIILLNLLTFPVHANTELSISVIIDDKIITNFDILKENQYLKLLNNNLEKLNVNQITQISKNNLINENIKKKEIEKIFDLNKENKLITEVLENLYKKIGFQNENQFERILDKKKTYTIDEIKEKIKVELYWNDLIFLKYKDQIDIDEKDLKIKLDKMNEENINQYFLSEIVFEKKNNTNIEDQINEIKNSINEIGFNNTANLYSISESSKFGGKIGWIDSNNLSEKISNELKKLQTGKITDVIQSGNTYLIIKIEDKKTIKKKFDYEKELRKMIDFETNKQLNKFSIIYFNKAKMNISINEK